MKRQQLTTAIMAGDNWLAIIWSFLHLSKDYFVNDKNGSEQQCLQQLYQLTYSSDVSMHLMKWYEFWL